jgi:hypothetical protein
VRAALDNPWLNRAGNLVFAAGAVQTGIRWVMGLPLNAVGLLLLAVGVALIALPKVQRFLPSREPPPELKREIATIQRELVRHENRRQNNGGSIWPIERPYQDLPIDQWTTHSPRLRLPGPNQEVVSTAYELAGRFNDEMLAGETTIAAANEPDLAGLRRAFEDAAAAVGLPPAPNPNPPTGLGEFGRRDDKGDLAKRCQALAGSVERWVEGFDRGHSERAERMVAEWLEADSTTDPAEARRKAYTRDEKNWEVDYRLKYEIEARKLFDEAFEMGEVAREHEQLAIAPLAIQFEAVPSLFNEIAARLYGQPAENLSS